MRQGLGRDKKESFRVGVRQKVEYLLVSPPLPTHFSLFNVVVNLLSGNIVLTTLVYTRKASTPSSGAFEFFTYFNFVYSYLPIE